MATRLSVGDGVGLALAAVAGEVACCVAPPAGEVAGEPAACVDAPATGWPAECLPSVVARAYAPPPAVGTTMTATTMNRPRLPPRARPPPLGGPPGGPDAERPGRPARLTRLAALT